MDDAIAIAKSLRSLRLAHARAAFAYRNLHAQCEMAGPDSVIALVGPTRVGKTVIAGRVCDEILASITPDPRYKPIIWVDAVQTNGGNVSTKYLLARICEEGGHPSYRQGVSGYMPRSTESAGMLHGRHTMISRETRLLVVDEAHHLLRHRFKQDPSSTLDIIKSLGTTTGATVVLVGGYRMLELLFGSSHLNGRLTVIDFAAYDPEGADRDDFEDFLHSLDNLLPWRSGESLVMHRELVQAGTLGICGMAVGWACDALALMKARKDTKLLRAHFELSRLKIQTEEIRLEIDQGRRLLENFQAREGTAIVAHERTSAAPDVAPAPMPPRPRARRPFTRNPAHDRVGTP